MKKASNQQLLTQARQILQLLASCILFLQILLGSNALYAQQYSYDGNRWYEIEVLVFAHELQPAQISEAPLPALVKLGYLPNLRQLRPAISSYLIDFDAAFEADKEQTDQDLSATSDIKAPQTPDFGPLETSAVERAFRVDDFSRDPYIDLDKRFWKFSRDLQRLEDSERYRVLWHGIWRQPMQSSAQAPAIYIDGGNAQREHHELEGSSKFFDKDGRIQLDLNIWLSRYQLENNARLTEWNLPDIPLESSTAPVRDEFFSRAFFDPVMHPSSVWQIRTQKELSTEEVYYLDNPAFGVLLQVRPYQLPSALLRKVDEDF